MSERTCSVDGCTKAHRAKGLCSTHYNQLKPNRHAVRHVPCTVCGKTVAKTGGGTRRPVCSTECRWWTQFEGISCPIPETHPAHPRWAGRRLPVLYVAPKPVVKPQAKKRWVAGYCHRCGTAYIAEDYTDTARFCSLRCTKHVGRQRYRARKREAYVSDVSPAKIYERDGWRCQLCRKQVDRTKVVPHPKAAVLDHILPLAQGGTHEPTNVQCAHFLCNSIKRDRVSEAQQLMLFG